MNKITFKDNVIIIICPKPCIYFHNSRLLDVKMKQGYQPWVCLSDNEVCCCYESLKKIVGQIFQGA